MLSDDEVGRGGEVSSMESEVGVGAVPSVCSLV
jgi:hypothetical protein